MKQAIRLRGSEDQPEVIFDKDKNEFKISGRSLPEDSYEFYRPLIDWIDEYVKNPNAVTHFHISLEYLNSSSVKQIFFLLSKLEIIINNGKEAKVSWYCRPDDDLMQTKCSIFKKLLKVPFVMTEHDRDFSDTKT